eukprot:5595977-Prymnesium_polylepis.1
MRPQRSRVSPDEVSGPPPPPTAASASPSASGGDATPGDTPGLTKVASLSSLSGDSLARLSLEAQSSCDRSNHKSTCWELDISRQSGASKNSAASEHSSNSIMNYESYKYEPDESKVHLETRSRRDDRYYKKLSAISLLLTCGIGVVVAYIQIGMVIFESYAHEGLEHLFHRAHADTDIGTSFVVHLSVKLTL